MSSFEAVTLVEVAVLLYLRLGTVPEIELCGSLLALIVSYGLERKFFFIEESSHRNSR